jgi:hypothetical protein
VVSRDSQTAGADLSDVQSYLGAERRIHGGAGGSSSGRQPLFHFWPAQFVGGCIMADAFDAIGGILDLIGSVANSCEHSALRKDVEQLKEKAAKEPDPLKAELAELRAANGELGLYVATLLRLLLAKEVIGREELTKLLEQVDDEDGKRDQCHVGKLVP